MAKNLFTHLGKCLLICAHSSIPSVVNEPPVLDPSTPCQPTSSTCFPKSDTSANTLSVPVFAFGTQKDVETPEGTEPPKVQVSFQLGHLRAQDQPRNISSFPNTSAKKEAPFEEDENSCESYHTAPLSLEQSELNVRSLDVSYLDLAESFIAATKRASGNFLVASCREPHVLVENVETKESHTLQYRGGTSSLCLPHTAGSNVVAGSHSNLIMTSSAVEFCSIVSGCKKSGPRIAQFPVADISANSALGIQHRIRSKL